MGLTCQLQYCGRAGCTLVENNSWPSAPTDIPIVGLKDLPLSKDPLPHTHLMFGHCYKQQAGWSQLLARFHKGGGTLYDYEFLTDEQGRRVAAFGYHAGFAGAAVGALAFAAEKAGSVRSRRARSSQYGRRGILTRRGGPLIVPLAPKRQRPRRAHRLDKALNRFTTVFHTPPRGSRCWRGSCASGDPCSYMNTYLLLYTAWSSRTLRLSPTTLMAIVVAPDFSLLSTMSFPYLL